MDPTTNPIPTPTPQPPVGGVPPQAPAQPVPPAPSIPPVPPVTPPSDQSVGGASLESDISTQAGPGSVSPVVPPVSAPVNPVFRPTNIDGINTTPATPQRPMSMPVSPAPESAIPSAEPSVESTMPSAEVTTEEPVPSGNPFLASSAEPTPSVSFADPALQPEAPQTAQPAESEKKKSSKTTLIVLSVIAFLVAAALAAVLVMMLNNWGPFGSGDTSTNTSGGSSSVAVDDNSSNGGSTTSTDGEDSSTSSASGDTIVCTMTQTETTGEGADAVTATSDSTVTLYFNSDNLFARASLKAEVITEDGTSPTVVTKEMTAKELMDMSGIDATEYGIQVSPDGSISATKEQVLKALNENDDDITCISSSAM